MKVTATVLILCLLLTGCSAFMEGEYNWQDSHPIQAAPGSSREESAASYTELIKALSKLVRMGAEQGTILVGDYDREELEEELSQAVAEVTRTDPVAAYAVEKIDCDIGTSGSKPALAVQISYIHDKSEIRKIKRVADINQAQEAIATALVSFETGIVMQIDSYEPADFAQIVEDYALLNPHTVMETPQVSETVYPDRGKTRVVELKFSYQTSRDSLKVMQDQVQPLFSSAVLFVSGEGAQGEKLSQLYGFLMNRYDYQIGTSITPAYHLLRHGIGDSRAFASIYSLMCRQAGLECMVISGTRNGESWYWNIVSNEGEYYHVDLLICKENGNYRECSDEEMEGYVWDFAAYPPCTNTRQPEPEEVPEEEIQ